MPRLEIDYSIFLREADNLIDLVQSVEGLEPRHKKLIAEIVLVRLALALENRLKSIFCKISCGAHFVDGTQPNLIQRCRSIDDAIRQMEHFQRLRVRQLRWNDGSEIRENVAYLIDGTDHSVSVVRNIGFFLTELRFIRNRIVHKNPTAIRNFAKIIRKYYGAYHRHITCGTLLLSDRVSRPSLIEVHLRRAKVFMSDLVRSKFSEEGGGRPAAADRAPRC